MSVLDHQIATMNTLAIFSSGLALALIFCLALAPAVNGATHRPTHRRHRRLRTHDSGETTHLEDMMGPDQRA